MFSSILLAMGAPAQGEGAANPLLSMAPFFLMIGVFYFILIRPQARKQKEHEQMLNELKKGDRVVTTGGLHGKIANVKEDIVVLTVADNLKVEVSKGAVSRVSE